jgi:hypothetical protein
LLAYIKNSFDLYIFSLSTFAANNLFEHVLPSVNKT